MFLLVGLLISHVSSSSKTRTSLTLSPSCSLIYSRVKGPPPVAVSLAPLTNGVRIGETSVPAGGAYWGSNPPPTLSPFCVSVTCIIYFMLVPPRVPVSLLFCNLQLCTFRPLSTRPGTQGNIMKQQVGGDVSATNQPFIIFWQRTTNKWLSTISIPTGHGIYWKKLLF